MATRNRDDREQAFLAEYLIDFNGTRAAKAAGYKDPKQSSWQLLQRDHIKEEIDRVIAERRARNKLTVDTIEGMLRDIAEVDMMEIFDAEGKLRPLNEIPPKARKAIRSIRTEEVEHIVTGKISTRQIVELWDKKGAIELLGKYKKMFTDKLELDANVRQKVSFKIDGMDKEG